LEDIRGEPIDRKFYAEELTLVKTTRRTEYLVDTILDTRVRRCIRELLVRWRGYCRAFDTWIPASDIIRFGRR
jgi:hypothetical protein